jgi:hypothetical protein
MIGYVISSLLWAVGGLVVGFFLGRSGQVFPIIDPKRGPKLPAHQPASDGSDGAVTDRRLHRLGGSLRFDRVVGWVIIVMAVISVITVSYAVSRQQQAVTCQADYNAAFVAALNERSDAAAADRQAQRELLTGMVIARDPATSRTLIDAYLRKLDDADDQRDENPLPQRPIC